MLRHISMVMPKRPFSTARATALVCAIALLATGCTSASSSGHGTDRSEVPATAYLSVTEIYPVDGTPTPSQKSLTFAVTDQRTIAQLAALVNSLPTSPKQIMTPCPFPGGPAYELDFQNAKDTTPVAEVSTMCFGVMFTVHEHSEPVLGNEAGFFRSVSSLVSPSIPDAGTSAVSRPSSSRTQQ